MIKCFQCKKEKVESEMALRQGQITDFCKSCKSSNQSELYRRKRFHFPFNTYLDSLKGRAKKGNIPFDLTVEDIKSVWTGVCPAFNVPLSWEHDKTNESSSELDRIVPEKGYVKGNVRWISRRANRIKNDSTIEELEKVLNYLKDSLCTEIEPREDSQIMLDGVSLKERNSTFQRRARVRQTACKLTESDVLEIKTLLRDGNLQKKEIAKKFGISDKNLWKISAGKSWTHIQLS